MELSQAANLDTSEPSDTTPANSSHASSQTPSSSLSTPPSTSLVPSARVQKLKAQISTSLYYIQPLMKKSISEAKDRTEKKVSQYTEQRI